MGMRTVLVLAMLLLPAATAQANECNSGGVHVSTGDVPLGCPVLMIADTFASFAATITVTHYDPQTGQPTQTDVTGAVTQGADVQVPVEKYRYHGCNLIDDGPEPTTYRYFEVALNNVAVGDVLDTGASDFQPHVVAAAPCPAFVAPSLACADPIMNCEGADGGSGGANNSPDGGGCNAGRSDAGAGVGVGLAFGLLALVATRSRRARWHHHRREPAPRRSSPRRPRGSCRRDSAAASDARASGPRRRP